MILFLQMEEQDDPFVELVKEKFRLFLSKTRYPLLCVTPLNLVQHVGGMMEMQLWESGVLSLHESLSDRLLPIILNGFYMHMPMNKC